jgi:hypothetical protein
VIFLQGMAEMAAFCLKCEENHLNFGAEVYKLFAHPSCAGGSKRPCSDQAGNEVCAEMLYDTYLDVQGFNVYVPCIAKGMVSLHPCHPESTSKH